MGLQHRASGDTVTLHNTPRIICNQQQAVQQLCAEGLGIAKLFSLDVAEPIAQGQLQRLLPDWSCGSLTIWALTPQRNALPARVRMALSALQGHFGVG